MNNGVEVKSGGVLFLSLKKVLFEGDSDEGDEGEVEDRIEEVVDNGDVGRC